MLERAALQTRPMALVVALRACGCFSVELLELGRLCDIVAVAFLDRIGMMARRACMCMFLSVSCAW